MRVLLKYWAVKNITVHKSRTWIHITDHTTQKRALALLSLVRIFFCWVYKLIFVYFSVTIRYSRTSVHVTVYSELPTPILTWAIFLHANSRVIVINTPVALYIKIFYPTFLISPHLINILKLSKIIRRIKEFYSHFHFSYSYLGFNIY